MGRVEFYYDLVSPYSYLAHRRVREICDGRGAELVLRPVLLGALHKAAGLRAPVESELKARYQARDIERWAERYGLPLRFPKPFPFRTLKTMRAAVYLESEGMLEPFTWEAFAHYWERGGAPKGLDEADEEAPITEVARRIGVDPEEVLAGATSPEAKEGLKAATNDAVARGIFAAPTFFVGDEMFWGNDRLDFVEAALGAERASR
ncbi:MAG: 2-hydroxychromene-2-carboxylate isomerase [Actinomycetota bacterium]